jgi:hypothetical protein
MAHEIKSPETIAKFVFGGNAVFTLKSNTTGRHFTFKTKVSKDGNVHFVSVLTGPDNTSDFEYLGFFVGPDFRHGGQKTRISKDAPSAKAFDWFNRHILRAGQADPRLSVYHEDKCGRCNRPLTDPESIEAGIGPECRKRIQCLAA